MEEEIRDTYLCRLPEHSTHVPVPIMHVQYQSNNDVLPQPTATGASLADSTCLLE